MLGMERKKGSSGRFHNFVRVFGAYFLCFAENIRIKHENLVSSSFPILVAIESHWGVD